LRREREGKRERTGDALITVKMWLAKGRGFSLSISIPHPHSSKQVNSLIHATTHKPLQTHHTGGLMTSFIAGTWIYLRNGCYVPPVIMVIITTEPGAEIQ
jgi:hypothetical protein